MAPSMVRVARAASVCGLVLLLLGACKSAPGKSAGPSGPPSLSAPSPAATSLDPRSAAEQAALAAYRGMWQAFTAAGRTTNPHYDDLARFADGDAFNVLVAGLESNKKQGLITKGDLVPNPQVTQMTPADSPDTASIRDCLDTTQATRVKATPGGSPFVDTPGGRRLVTATAKNIGGTWKVISVVPMAVGTC